MARVPVPTNRARLVDDGISLRYTIPARRKPAVMLFLLVWLGGWVFGETMVLGQVLHSPVGPKGFLLFWLAGWTMGGGFAVFVLTWMGFGCELVALETDALMVRQLLFGFGRTREYEISAVKAVRVGAGTPSFAEATRSFSGSMQFYGLAGGPLTFDYGARTVRCGAGLDEAEARDVVERMWQRNPRLRPPPSSSS